MKKKDDLLRELEQIEVQLATLREEIDKLEEKESYLQSLQDQLENEIDAIAASEETQRILDSIHDITAENAMYISLDSDTKTTPVMEKFYQSNKSFLIFSKLFHLMGNSNSISLVVKKDHPDVNRHNSDLTMTNIKEVANTYITSSSTKYLKESSRRYHLYKELEKICQKSPQRGERIPFDLPCKLRGQTFKDQRGYGSRYCGEDLIHPGTEYGATTNFLIIGALIE